MLQQPNDHISMLADQDIAISGYRNDNATGLSVNDKNKAFLAKVIAEQSAEANYQLNESPSKDETNFPHLSVDVNDVVSVEQDLDDKFILARSDQLVGRLAKSLCLLLDEQIPATLCQYLKENQFYDLHVCFASFVAQDVGDLSITKGDVIVAINSVNEHWIQGQVCFDSQANCWPTLALGKQVGTFPLNHCWRLDQERVKIFCQSKLKQQQQIRSALHSTPWSAVDLTSNGAPVINAGPNNKPLLSTNHASSVSSGGSSSLHSTDNNNANHNNNQQQYKNHYTGHNNHQQLLFQKPPEHDSTDSNIRKPPPRPDQLPKQISQRSKSTSEQTVSRPASILSNKQQDKLKGWLHSVRKKTTRCAMRISANLGLISLTRDEEFERHYESFKSLEKSIRVFIKNLSLFIDHFQSFLLALQSTSDNLADFYRDETHKLEITEMRKKNKALNCEHFHAFKRTVERQVIAVASQLLQKFSGPHQLISKRSAKLLDYDTKTKEVESCRDLDKKTTLREQYVIAKDLYDRINGQLIRELPLFNQYALNIFKECVLVLLDSRRSFILAYTRQTEALLKTPLLSSFTASDVATTIMMTCDFAAHPEPALPAHLQASMNNTMVPPPASSKGTNSDCNSVLNHDNKSSRATSEHGTQPSTSGTLGDGFSTRPSSTLSQLSSEFDQMALANREICSTPLSQVSGSRQQNNRPQGDENHQLEVANISSDVGDNPYDELDTAVRFAEPESASSDNKCNENIESVIKASRTNEVKLNHAPTSFGNVNNKSSKDKKKKKRTKHQIIIASWPFESTGPNQLTIACDEPLKLLKGCDSIGNPEWSLVKNQSNEIGYVPTAYLKGKD